MGLGEGETEKPPQSASSVVSICLNPRDNFLRWGFSALAKACSRSVGGGGEALWPGPLKGVGSPNDAGVQYPAVGQIDHTPHSIQAEGRVKVRSQGISTIQDQEGENPWR